MFPRMEAGVCDVRQLMQISMYEYIDSIVPTPLIHIPNAYGQSHESYHIISRYHEQCNEKKDHAAILCPGLVRPSPSFA